LFVDANGNVGVGAIPGYLVSAKSSDASFAAISSDDTCVIRINAQSGLAILETVTNTDLRIRTNSTERMRLTSAGLLGLGTSDPQQDLHINDATGVSRIRLSGGAANADNFDIGQSIPGASNSGFSIYDVDATASRLVIDSSGNVGIGTTNPGARAEIRQDGSSAVELVRLVNDDTSGAGSTIKFRNFYDSALISSTSNPGFSQGGTLRLQTYNGSGALNTGLFINTAGNVGIGTTGPSQLLHVAGNTRIGANDASSALLQVGAGATGSRFAVVDLVGDTTYTDYGLRIIRGNTGANTASQITHRGTGSFTLQAVEGAPITFETLEIFTSCPAVNSDATLMN
jgi:hypothetical protein